MRLYNPFKVHIVEFCTGGYAIRALTLVRWVYYGEGATVFHYAHNAKVDTFTEAEKIRDSICNRVCAVI